MEIALIIAAILLAFTGILGCIVPGLPGPPLNYVSILLVQWAFSPFSSSFLIWWAVIVLLITIIDYVLPVWVSKKFGASRAGIIGSIAGMLIGMIFPPIGIIAGLIAGAVIGDLISGKRLNEAVYSGFGTAFGTLMSTGLKLIVSGILTWQLFKVTFCYITDCGNI
jgi:uncharacterized protein YqgC (DUF456 family)